MKTESCLNAVSFSFLPHKAYKNTIFNIITPKPT